jgi:glucan 1,3-beta-glucosidase
MHIANIDEHSDVDIYSLSTVGVDWQLSVNQVGIIRHDKNPNGFAATATSWTRYTSLIQILVSSAGS